MLDVVGEFRGVVSLDLISRPKRGRAYWRDATTPGLYLVVSATGRRAWEAELDDRSERQFLGLYRPDDGMSLRVARSTVKAARKRVSAGLDPWPDPRKRLAPLLEKLREIDALKESRPGIFRFKSKPFLHFHGTVADVRLSDAGFTKLDASTRAGQRALLRVIKEHIDS